ncbi:glycosyl hydrolase 53 family protein [Paenibacillus alkaliterrae]|uniref:glycosyl hydrolase 53 family protein n=1 Tax=Paenibacillus alkaliterrae TaxID=320909 RepID=UPI001F255E3F|nr:glycosyl hydrolase 53 family protein [Paenibacillus alkaliterrae]MCF2937816.1 glycosyl hydrolase 53 family protein [Paenibacillus alkaliterrae]
MSAWYQKRLNILLTFVIALTTLMAAGPQERVSAEALSDPDTFIKGVDISTLQAIEAKGIKFYDEGVEKELLVILKEHGVNYVRLRVWNNPVLAEGFNDAAHLITMSQRVKAAGMKLLVDFHYSDFWADPGKQVKPEAWKDLDFAGLKTAVYDYTAEVMNSLKAVNAYPDMVQIGNEINSGMIHPEGSTANFSQLTDLLKEGVRGVRDTTPVGHETKIMLHLAEGGDNHRFRTFFDQVETAQVDYDVIGLSYYPYWHGTFQQLKTNMNDMVARYGKEIVVAEMAYAFTLDNDDSLSNIVGADQTKIAGFPATVENQKLVTETVFNTVADVDEGKGLGAFYWEPAWVAGVGWTLGEGNGWENQAMFDFDGEALSSLDAFNYTPGSMDALTPIMVYAATDAIISLGETPALPAQVNVLFNEGSITPQPVVWDEISEERLNTSGTFTVNGTVSGISQKATIKITILEDPNLVQNPGFETGDLTSWTVSGTTAAARVKNSPGDAHSQNHAFDYYYGTPYAYKLSQTVTGLDNGTYELRGWSSGGGGESKLKLFAEDFGGEALSVDAVNTGWNVWKQYKISNIKVTNGQVKLGFDVEAPGDVWGYFDDFELVKTDEQAVPNMVQNEGFERGSLEHWSLTGTENSGKIEENAGKAVSGTYSFNYWNASNYAFQLTQTVTGLENGIYALKGWSSGGGGETKLKLFAETAGGTTLSTDVVNTGFNVWKQYIVPNIVVTNGQAMIGFDVEAPAGTWGNFDDIELVMVNKAEPSQGGTGNSDNLPKPGNVTVSPGQMKKNEDGSSTVKLPAAVTEVVIPSGLYDQLNKQPVKFEAENLSVEIPAELFKELLSKFTGTANSSITLKLQPVGKTDTEQMLEQSGQQAEHTRIELVGEAYEFKLSIKNGAGDEAVLSQFSKPIKIRLKAGAASNDDKAGVYYIAEDGSLEYAGGELIDGEWIVQIEHFSMYAVLKVTKQFDDVPAGYWAHGVISELAAKQFILGTTVSSFEPDRTMSRAEFAELLVRVLKLKSGQKHNFADVADDAWYTEAVSAAYEAGIINGRSESSFDPDASILRQEMAVMLMKAYSIKTDTSDTSATSEIALPFIDSDWIDGWAMASIKSAFETGLLKGRHDNRFVPNGQMTRAEATQAVYRLISL